MAARVGDARRGGRFSVTEQDGWIGKRRDCCAHVSMRCSCIIISLKLKAKITVWFIILRAPNIDDVVIRFYSSLHQRQE